MHNEKIMCVCVFGQVSQLLLYTGMQVHVIMDTCNTCLLCKCRCLFLFLMFKVLLISVVLLLRLQ